MVDAEIQSANWGEVKCGKVQDNYSVEEKSRALVIAFQWLIFTESFSKTSQMFPEKKQTEQIKEQNNQIAKAGRIQL